MPSFPNRWKTLLLAIGAVAMGCGILPSDSSAQSSYPDKPIRFIVGFGPGTIFDLIGRLVANEMEKQLGQPIILEFKTGAESTIAANYVVTSPPDGYTLFLGGTSSFHPLVQPNNAVDATKQLAPISLLGNTPWIMVVRSNREMSSLSEMVSYAKSHPNELMYGKPSAITGFGFDIFQQKTGIALKSVPYRTSAQLGVALLGSEVDLAMGAGPGSFLPSIQDGKLRVLFVASPNRYSILPNVPTSAEVGLPGFIFGTYTELWAPAGTPKDIIQKLNSTIVSVLKDPAVRRSIEEKSQSDIVGSSPEELLAHLQRLVDQLGEIAGAANTKKE